MKSGQFLKNYRRSKNKWIPRQTRSGGGLHPKGPNATEHRFLIDNLWSIRDRVTYESRSFEITKTTRRIYTPDFVETKADGDVIAVYEVKGAYKLGSEDRARLAWEIAAELNPSISFNWAVRTRTGWEIERWQNAGRSIFVKLPGETKFHEEQPDWRRHRKRKSK